MTEKMLLACFRWSRYTQCKLWKSYSLCIS